MTFDFTFFIIIRRRAIIECALVVDYATGFGGKYGVQTDRKDKSALGWDHQESLSQHDSQKGKQLHI